MGIVPDDLAGKIRYLSWAASRVLKADTICPSCGSASSRLVRRKMFVTSLYDCPNCHIRFRVPKESTERAEKLYKKETYRQGLTTSLPAPAELARLLDTGFIGSEHDCTRYIAVLKRLLAPGAKIIDFGCSWGYGSWQIAKAGFAVYSYEVGEQRARYAEDQLSCNIVHDLRSLDATIDCLFSSHVIEHLPDPAMLLSEARRLLVPGGYFVCFCPNGDPARRDKGYHKGWGKVHPLLITPDFMRWAFKKHGLTICEINTADYVATGELLAIGRMDGR